MAGLLLAAFFLMQAHAWASSTDRVKEIIERECVNLKKERLTRLIRLEFAKELQKDLEPELLKIMEGVIKRADFDGISEAKTSGIIRLVYDAYKQGAPLEYLDEIFDVAYAKAISAGQLASAANALEGFNDSDVPRDVFEEFVYHSMEEAWSPEAVPVLSRGLIYGVERGLTPERVAIAIMVEVDQGGLKKKSAGAIVSEAVKFVRNIEPQKWRPPAPEKEAKAMDEKEKRDLLLRQEAEKARQRAEREARRGIELEALKQRLTTGAKQAPRDMGKLYSAVEGFLGVPYRFGGDSEDGIDCSAFTRRVYRKIGLELPRTAREQAGVGLVVTDAGPGDLVFFDTSIMGVISHVGVGLEDGVFAHASKSKGVTKSSLKERYYMKRYVKAKRILAR